MEGIQVMDMTSYLMGIITGIKKGTGVIVLDSDAFTFTDPDSDGNIVIAEEEA